MPEWLPLLAADAIEVGEFVGRTTLHPLGLAVTLIGGAAMFLLPRQWALLPMLVTACFVAPAQRIVIFTLDFNLLRIMVLFGAVRVLFRDEHHKLRLGALDWSVIGFNLVLTAAHTIQKAEVAALIFQLGNNYDSLGMYFLFRCLVRDWADVRRLMMGFAALSVPLAACFAIEHTTARNLFAFLGGVPEITKERQGRLRCQGAFAHAILAGAFWATSLPLIASLWWQKRRLFAVVGTCCGLAIVVFCASSTPVMGVAVGVLGAAFYPLRRYMRGIRWGLLFTGIALHLAMNNPIWHLFSRIKIVGGSTGDHRYRLIDNAVKNAEEWWLFGTPSTAHWGHHMFDITNLYLLYAFRGGLLSLVLFIATITLAYRGVGRLLRRFEAERNRRILSWGLGAALFSHTVTFFAVSYYAQIIMIWWLLLAVIASLEATYVTAPGARPKRQAGRPAAANRRRIPG